MSTPLETDTEFQEYKIGSVGTSEPNSEIPYFIINCVKGGSLCVPNAEQKTLPRKGQTARFYGRGFGHNVRGVVVKDVVYYYRTAEEEEQERQDRKIKDAATKKKEWEDALEENTARIDAMPASFQKRVHFFLRTPGWGPTFGKYELFVCSEAIKIAAACTTPEDVNAFYSDSARQDGVIDKEHSGNTFGAACSLAARYLHDDSTLWQAHGALCGLVGCEGYGCFANTDAVEQLAISETFPL